MPWVGLEIQGSIFNLTLIKVINASLKKTKRKYIIGYFSFWSNVPHKDYCITLDHCEDMTGLE